MGTWNRWRETTSIELQCLESSQCYLNEGSPADMLTDDEENGRDGVTSPQANSPIDYHQHQQTTNLAEPFSPTQNPTSNGTDDVSTTTNQSAELRSSSPNKILLGANFPASSSSSASKRLTGTLNRLLQSAVNRPNGHHYPHLLNGSSSSPSASSSTNTNLMLDSTGKEPKLTAELTTQAIESKTSAK